MNTIIFDLVGVITTEKMIATNIFYPYFKKCISYQDFKKRYFSLCLGVTGPEEFYKGVISSEKISEFEEKIFEELQFNHEVCKLIMDLSGKNKLILFSEIPKSWAYQILKNSGVSSCFRTILISSEQKTTKPSKHFFELLGKEIDGYKRGLYIEDKLKNIKACEKYLPALICFHFNNKEEKELVNEIRKIISQF